MNKVVHLNAEILRETEKAYLLGLDIFGGYYEKWVAKQHLTFYQGVGSMQQISLPEWVVKSWAEEMDRARLEAYKELMSMAQVDGTNDNIPPQGQVPTIHPAEGAR